MVTVDSRALEMVLLTYLLIVHPTFRPGDDPEKEADPLGLQVNFQKTDTRLTASFPRQLVSRRLKG